MRRMPMCRISSLFAWIGLAGLMGCLGCAPWLLTQTVAPSPSETLETSWFAAPLPERFHDANGRQRVLPAVEEATSIRLDAKSEVEWPSFLDAVALGPVRATAWEDAAMSGPGAMLALRLPEPSLDSPGRRW